MALVQLQYLGTALSIVLKFYTKGAKGLKLKITNILGLIPEFVEVTGEKLIQSLLSHQPPPSFMLNRTNVSKLGKRKVQNVKIRCMYFVLISLMQA